MPLLARRRQTDTPVSEALELENSRSRHYIAGWRARNAGRAHAHEEFSRLKHEHPVFGFVDCRAGGIDFALFHANDDIVAWEYLWYGEDAYEPEITATWLEWCRRAGVVLDVGGYSGVMSVLAAKASPRARVHLFEPMERTAERAKINLRANGVAPRVSVHARALSDEEGIAEIQLYRNEDFLGTGNALDPKPGRSPVGRKLIEKVRGDDYLGEIVPDVIKIDTEGHELACLRGLEGAIRRGRPKMIVEVWEATRAETLSMLETLGYACEPFEAQPRPVMNFRCEPR